MAITTTKSMLVAYFVIVSKIVIRGSNIVGFRGGVSLCVFVFVNIVSDVDSERLLLYLVEVAVYAVVYFIRVMVYVAM